MKKLLYLLLGAFLVLTAINYQQVVDLIEGPKQIELQLPEGFRGRIDIVYPSPCEMTPILEDGKEVITIPPSGLVFYAGELDEEKIEFSYSIEKKEKKSPF